MILVFHGYGQPTSSIEEITRLSYSDTNTRYISVYPEGIENVWLGDPGSPHPELDDRPLINSLLDELENNFCVDKSRIYTTGLSNGGGFSGLLACYPPTSSRIAAFSAVSGAYYLQESLNQTLFEKEGCQPGNIPRKIPYLHIHGKKDMVIAYNGDNSGFDIDQNHIPDPDTLPIPTWLQDWVERNGCLKDGSVNRYLKTGHVSNSTTVMENGSVERSVWTCAGYQDVVTGYLVKELGHGWPSTVPLGGILEEFRLGPSAWNASALLMDWFGRWSLSE